MGLPAGGYGTFVVCPSVGAWRSHGSKQSEAPCSRHSPLATRALPVPCYHGRGLLRHTWLGVDLFAATSPEVSSDAPSPPCLCISVPVFPRAHVSLILVASSPRLSIPTSPLHICPCVCAPCLPAYVSPLSYQAANPHQRSRVPVSAKPIYGRLVKSPA